MVHEFVMDDFGRFDEGKGTLRLFFLLCYAHDEPFPRVELLKELSDEGIGRTAAYRDIDTCKDLGLVEERTFNLKGKRVLSLHLTEKGHKLIPSILEIHEIFTD
jgi:hypothetical protein